MYRNLFPLLALLLLGGFGAQAQELTDAQAVVDKYLTAVGGLDKLRGIKDMTLNMTADIQGRALEMETKLKMPDKFKQVSYMMGNEAGGSVYDGKTMSRSMRGQQTTKEGKEAFQEFLQNHPFPELYYDTLGIAKKLVGVEKIGDTEAYNIEYTAPWNTWHDYFDKTTGLKIRRTAVMESPRGKSEVQVNFGDYKAVSGIMFPYTRSQKSGQFEMSMETSSIKLNKGLDDKLFKVK